MDKIIQLAVALIVAWLVIQYLPGPDRTDPRPKPGPVDPVDPRPSPEPDFSQYEQKIFERVMAVKSRTRKADCEQLSGDFQSIIDRIDSGTITTNQGVVDALTAAIRKLPSSWYGQVREILNKVLQPLTNDGSLSTPQRWANLLRVAKRGIDRAKAESTGVADEPF